MENLIEELTKVNPANLSEEGLKLFNKINEIIDRNQELEEENKKLNNANKIYINCIQNIAPVLMENYIEKSLIKEKILNPMKEEHDKAIKGFIKRNIPQCIEDGVIAQELGYFIGKIEELLGEKK